MSTITSYGNSEHSTPRAGSRRCLTAGCEGEIVRHSLGCGLAVGRCTRCFARYELAGKGELPAPPTGLRRFLHEVVSWREDD